jgi:hypothetical protein
MLYIPKPKTATAVPITTPITVRGRYLAHNRLDARDRAQLAADIIAGRIAIDGNSLTIGQIIALCRASDRYVDEARFPDRANRVRRRNLATAFNEIDFDQRVELCRVIGAERVWDALAAAVD